MIIKNFSKSHFLYLLISVILILTVLAGCSAKNGLESKMAPRELEKIEIQNTLSELENYGIVIVGERNFPDFIRWLRGIKSAISLLPPSTLETITYRCQDCRHLLIIEFIKDHDTG